MSKDTFYVSSNNQTGGITAGKYNRHIPTHSTKSKKKKSWSIWLGAGGALVTILTYFGLNLIPKGEAVMSNDPFYVSSNYQLGGITAGQYNQYNFGKQPRHLDGNGKTELLQKLKIGNDVILTATWGDQEAIKYAWQIKEFLDSKGFNTPKGIHQTLFTKPIEPVAIYQGESKTDIIVGANI